MSNNMALISRGYPKRFDSHRKDLLITLFQEVLAEHPAYRTYLPAVTESMLQEAADAVHIRVQAKKKRSLTSGNVTVPCKQNSLYTKTSRGCSAGGLNLISLFELLGFYYLQILEPVVEAL